MKIAAKFLFLILFSKPIYCQNLFNAIDVNKTLIDNANLYSSEEKDLIEKKIDLFKNANNYYIRILTIDGLITGDSTKVILQRNELFKEWLHTREDYGILLILSNNGKSLLYKIGEKAKALLTKDEMLSLTFNTINFYGKSSQHYKGVNTFFNGLHQLLSAGKNLASLAFSDSSDNLLLDHFFILTKDIENASNCLIKNGFKKLDAEAIHKGQGTKGNYFYFSNIILELLTIIDSSEVELNTQNIGFNFNQRMNLQSVSESSGFGFGLTQIGFDTLEIPFKTRRYGSNGYLQGPNYLRMAASNVNLREPVFFIVSPAMRNRYKTLTENQQEDNTGTIRDHANGIKRLTKIALSGPLKEDEYSETLKVFSKFKNVTISNEPKNLLVLEFDNGIQGKQIDLEKELNLKISY